ncbi:transketolase family protein [Aquabacterium sp. OR-4]|uniref:transketolase family protein n=1 Tax=Aquabacterium sp. OR-4 TaxID=2978127 RepID=UPI0021B2A496|nr:transketolase [Aquabacterium sp. OR-4]MDT7834494.1 transketolase [Aquabacterium sp. OR-4]
MRNAFIDELVALAAVHPQIALVVGDLGYSVVEPFADRFPDRFINAGVAEQNMTGLAAGMASEGYHVFTYSIANFPSFRCAEQIRNDVAYHQLPVTVVAVGGGLAYGALGYSHHAVQDYALFRSFPNLLMAAPGDPMEVRACMRYLVEHPQPSYLRLGKAGEPSFHDSVPTVSPGRWLAVSPPQAQPQASRTVLCTGATLALAMQHWRQAADPALAVHSLPLWGMGCKSGQAEQVERFAHVLSMEDHLRDGGFGSWLQEALCVRPDLLPRLRADALDPVVCGTVGSQAMLNELGGLGRTLSSFWR